MTEKQANELAAKLNGSLADIISDIAFDTLGVRTRFIAFARKSGYDGGCFIRLDEDELSDATKLQLTATPLLRSMFTDGKLYMRAYLNERSNTLESEICISYDHHSGSNGLSGLAYFSINLSDETYKIRL